MNTVFHGLGCDFLDMALLYSGYNYALALIL